MATFTIATGITGGDAVCALADGTIAVSSQTGEITRYDGAGAVIETVSAGETVTALAAHPVGDGVLGATRHGIADIHFGPSPSVTIRPINAARGIVIDNATGTSIVTSTLAPGRVLRVPLDPTAKSATIVSGMTSPSGVVMRPGNHDALVLTRTNPAQLLRVDLDTGTVSPLLTDLGTARVIAWAAPAGPLLAAGTRDGDVVLVDTTNPLAVPVPAVNGLGAVWGIDRIPGANALVVGAGDALVHVDLPPAPSVQLDLPSEAMYLSSWARVGVATDGVSFDDLVFRVDPPHGGLVSHSVDATFVHRPSVVLAASSVVGGYKLIAHDRITGKELAVGEFEVTDAWGRPDGPPATFIGSVGTDVPDAAWGGGDPFVPQNLSVTPALGQHRVAVVIAESSDSTALTSAGGATLRAAWQNEVFDGVNRAGVLESARHYWNDVSGGRIDLVDAGVIGPVRLANPWASYATGVKTTTGKTDGWEAFGRAVVADIRAQNDAWAALGQPPVVDLFTVDSIVLVLRSLPGGGMNPGRFVWPSATRPGGGNQMSFEIGNVIQTIAFPWGTIEVSVPVNRTIQMLAMPDDWETRDSSSRVRGETVAHELGHNLGLPDEYARASHPQWAKDRDLAASTTTGASWSMMSWEEQFPQPTVVEKMQLGWVDAPHVRNLSFATLGPVDEEVVLHASDLGAPPAGRHSVAEVRIADGKELLLRVPPRGAVDVQGPGRARRPHRRRHRLCVGPRAERPAQHPAHP